MRSHLWRRARHSQAFVPKVHNREIPVANHPVAARHQQENHGRHLRSLHKMTPRVDTRWGQTWNGVKDHKQPMYTHVRHNLKRAQIQDERFAEIELENTVLLGKLSKILRRSRDPTKGTRDWDGGLRLTANQVRASRAHQAAFFFPAPRRSLA